MIYLDNASTTKIDPMVLEEMMPYLTEEYGNPGNLHTLGRNARKAIEDARKKVAAFVNARDYRSIVFTSGGTEANNMVFNHYGRLRDVYDVMISSVEHDSVIHSALRLKEDFCSRDTYYVRPDENGKITFEGFRRAIEEDCKTEVSFGDSALTSWTPKIGLVSIMYMNNETGVTNDVANIGKYCNENGILFHTDAVQAAACVQLDVQEIGCDFMSLSSHKIHGPKGIGALYVKDFSKMIPLILGGSHQELGKRGGTENVSGIVGFGKACELMMNDQTNFNDIVNYFMIQLSESLNGFGLRDILHVNGNQLGNNRKTINIRFDGVDAETLMFFLDYKGVYISAGSACRSFEQEPSRVLLEMGLSPEQARNSIRVSFSRFSTSKEAFEAAKAIAEIVKILRGV